jgi:WD40 repeat protein
MQSQQVILFINKLYLFHFCFIEKQTDLNDDSIVRSVTNSRPKRDSTISHVTHSSQDTHSRKLVGNENRTDLMTPTATTRSVHRHQPINRAPQIRCDADQTVFKIQKGVRTFDLCTTKNVLVTGGMDRVVRLWNPYLPTQPVARLRGHNAPVFLVKIVKEDNRLFSISTDKAVLVSVVCLFFEKTDFYFIDK